MHDVAFWVPFYCLRNVRTSQRGKTLLNLTLYLSLLCICVYSYMVSEICYSHVDCHCLSIWCQRNCWSLETTLFKDVPLLKHPLGSLVFCFLLFWDVLCFLNVFFMLLNFVCWYVMRYWYILVASNDVIKYSHIIPIV